MENVGGQEIIPDLYRIYTTFNVNTFEIYKVHKKREKLIAIDVRRILFNKGFWIL